MKKPTKVETESEFRRYMMIEAEENGYHVSHIESGLTAAGIPDLNLHRKGLDLWLELKVWDNGIHMRPPQRRWHRVRAFAGGRSYVLALIDGLVYVHPGEFAGTLGPKSALWKKGASFYLNDVVGMLVRL